MQTRVLSREEVREVENLIRENYGCSIDLTRFIVMRTKEDKIRISSKEVARYLNMKKARVLTVGLYLGKLKRNRKIQLSVEGAQMLGEVATKNVAVISPEDVHTFLKGGNVEPVKLLNCEPNNFVLVKSQEHVLGTGILRKGERWYVENLLPKARRMLW